MDLVKEALIKAGREDLIGFDQKCLIKPRKITKDIADRKKVGTRTGKKPGTGKRKEKAARSYPAGQREWPDRPVGEDRSRSREGRKK